MPAVAATEAIDAAITRSDIEYLCDTCFEGKMHVNQRERERSCAAAVALLRPRVADPAAQRQLTRFLEWYRLPVLRGLFEEKPTQRPEFDSLLSDIVRRDLAKLGTGHELNRAFRDAHRHGAIRRWRSSLARRSIPFASLVPRLPRECDRPASGSNGRVME